MENPLRFNQAQWTTFTAFVEEQRLDWRSDAQFFVFEACDENEQRPCHAGTGEGVLDVGLYRNPTNCPMPLIDQECWRNLVDALQRRSDPSSPLQCRFVYGFVRGLSRAPTTILAHPRFGPTIRLTSTS